jgi:hypothetical protein
MANGIEDAKKIVTAIAEYKRKNKVNYILSPLNDPSKDQTTKPPNRQKPPETTRNHPKPPETTRNHPKPPTKLNQTEPIKPTY